MSLLTVTGIGRRNDEAYILRDVSFSQKKLQKIAIAGETGSGKTTLLRVIAGLVEPDEGEVKFQNRKVTGPAEKLVPGHPGIAYLSQNFELPKFLRVEQVLSYANTVSQNKMDTLLRVCQVDSLMSRKTDQLSGGEKQRIAMCRLLLSSPKLLLLDEPFSHLDMPHKNTLKAVIREVTERLKITCILVSHDPADTLSWADTILVLKNGTVVQQGTPEEIYRQPKSEYVAGLFGKYFKPEKKLPQLGVNSNRAGRYLRPEDFRIARQKADKGIRGKVKDVGFYGSHYELSVSTAAGTITVRAEDNNFKDGANVFISLG